jgi:hypothetical protein
MQARKENIMEDSTLGTIYAIKHNSHKDYEEAVIDFWAEYTGTPAQYYHERILMDIAESTFRDFIATADNPSFVMWELFGHLKFDCKSFIKSEESFDKRVRNAIWKTFAGLQVRDSNGYINGFREMEVT